MLSSATGGNPILSLRLSFAGGRWGGVAGAILIEMVKDEAFLGFQIQCARFEDLGGVPVGQSLSR